MSCCHAVRRLDCRIVACYFHSSPLRAPRAQPRPSTKVHCSRTNAAHRAQGYGPRIRGKGVTMLVIWAGITTCIIHLTFPVISGVLVAMSGPAIRNALGDLTSTTLQQVLP